MASLRLVDCAWVNCPPTELEDGQPSKIDMDGNRRLLFDACQHAGNRLCFRGARLDLCQWLPGSCLGNQSNMIKRRSMAYSLHHQPVGARPGTDRARLDGRLLRAVRRRTRGKGRHRPDRFDRLRARHDALRGRRLLSRYRSASAFLRITRCICRCGTDWVPVGIPWNCSARPVLSSPRWRRWSRSPASFWTRPAGAGTALLISFGWADWRHHADCRRHHRADAGERSRPHPSKGSTAPICRAPD